MSSTLVRMELDIKNANSNVAKTGELIATRPTGMATNVPDRLSDWRLYATAATARVNSDERNIAI